MCRCRLTNTQRETDRGKQQMGEGEEELETAFNTV